MTYTMSIDSDLGRSSGSSTDSVQRLGHEIYTCVDREDVEDLEALQRLLPSIPLEPNQLSSVNLPHYRYGGYDDTPLHAAIRLNHVQHVRYLVRAGAKTQAACPRNCDEHGDHRKPHPAALACVWGSCDVLDYFIEEHGVDMNRKFLLTERTFGLPAISDLGEGYIDEFPESLLGKELNLLHWAIFSRRDRATYMIQYLIRRNAKGFLWNNDDLATAVRLASAIGNFVALALMARGRAKEFKTHHEDATQQLGTRTRWLKNTRWLGVESWHHDLFAIMACIVDEFQPETMQDPSKFWSDLFSHFQLIAGDEYFSVGNSNRLIREPGCTFDNVELIGKDQKRMPFLSLSVPFLVLVDADHLFARTETETAKLDRVFPQHIATSSGLHQAVQTDATLDEYCHPYLPPGILKERNKDQVLLRYMMRLRGRSVPEYYKGPYLAVSQFWLWKIGDSLFTSQYDRWASHPSRLAASCEGLLAARIAMKAPCASQNEVIGAILSSLLERLAWNNTGDISTASHKSVLERLAWKETASLSNFLQEETARLDLLAIFATSIASVSREVITYLEADNMDIKVETDFLHEIEDIREELSMIQTVLFQQEEVWREFASDAWPSFWPTGSQGPFRPRVDAKTAEERQMWRTIQKPQSYFSKTKRQLQKLDEDAERVQKSIELRLDLKERHTSLQQAKASLQEARNASVMSASVFGFTVITIVFTPLSFLTSLLALPIDRLQQTQATNGGVYSTNYAGKWLATTEIVTLLVTLLAVWAALEFFLEVKVAEKVRTWWWAKCTVLPRPQVGGRSEDNFV